MENRIIRKLVDMLLVDLQKAWSVIETMTFSYVRSEQNPQFANFIAPSDIVLATTFKIELDWERAVIGYCVPYSTVEPVKDRLHGRFLSEYAEIDQTMRKRISGHLTQLPMEASVEVGTLQVSLRELLNWRTGDVLRLDAAPQDPHRFKVQNVPKGTCVAGQRNGSYAVELLSIGDKGNKPKEERSGSATGPDSERERDGREFRAAGLSGSAAPAGT
jgi:flagellar motor switch protein FliM